VTTRGNRTNYFYGNIFGFRQNERDVRLDFFNDSGTQYDSTDISRFPENRVSNPNFVPGYIYRDWTLQDWRGVAELSFLKITFPEDSSQTPLVQQKLFVQPNPSQGHTCISFASDYIGMVDVRVFSESGQLVQTFQSLKLNHLWESDFGQQGIPVGTYFLYVRAGEEVLSGKWVKI
jgi:hypothetical protein